MAGHTRNISPTKAKRPGFGAAWITVGSLALAILLGVFAWLQVDNYGKNVIEIFAEQQDAYVQLVLDQINLVEDRSNEEIVRDILGTIDGNSSEYWTLSENDSLVFVKDVAESNRYRGFSTQTYFDTSTAKDFIEALMPDQVKHAVIVMDDRSFIASGVAFQYNGSIYRMCLLTSEHMVVDSNAYLAARVNLGIAIGICLVAMVMIALLTSIRGDKWKRKSYSLENENFELRLMVERLNDRISGVDSTDTRGIVYNEQAAELLFRKILERNEVPNTFMVLEFASPLDEDAFLKDSFDIFGKRVVKFRLGAALVLIFLGKNAQEAQNMLAEVPKHPIIVRGIFEMCSCNGITWESVRDALERSARGSNVRLGQ